ncbi:MAG TPA: DNA-binding protein [Elusimicrobia bacterium]|nr:DNA-binding protein [Elusimicrobiota bacterium]HBT62097.1 DNA-binding protein [Elusimicrobiota bacterium]
MKHLIPADHIEQKIHLLRGHRVMLDSDLALIYGVTTKRLNQQVYRNKERFPADFMFRLTPEERDSLRLQIATLKTGRGQHQKYLPYAFTEHGAVMLSAVLRTPIAVSASIQIVRAFNRLRQMALAHKDLAVALAELARRVTGHDEQFQAVFDAIRELMDPPLKPRKQIGFTPPGKP